MTLNASQEKSGQCLTNSETTRKLDSKALQNGKEETSALDEELLMPIDDKGRSEKCLSATPLSLVICKPSISETTPEREITQMIIVPDAEFHSFEPLRTERDVAPGHIWAIYDEHDGMPRFYGLITQVCPSPFKVELSWLEPDKKKRKWVEATGISITCGEFEISPVSEIEKNIGVFSHMVLEKTGSVKGKVEVYPKEAEVWAIFSDRDGQNMNRPKPILTPNGDFSQYYIYDIVQMLEDYSAKDGVPAVRLIKTKGYKTVFHSHQGMYSIRTYMRKDLRKFSHSIPCEKIDRDCEKIDRKNPHDILWEAVELDPAALPIEYTNAGTSDAIS